MEIFPGAVSASLEPICAAFAATLKTKVKSDAVPTEVQRNDDCVKSVFRAILRLLVLEPDAPRLKELVESIEGDERHKGKWAVVREECA